jgi:probable rRNA maturation factor
VRLSSAGGVLNRLPQVEVTVVSDAAIAELHVRFMGVEGPTDVLTFEHGEIVIGAETARANAAAFGIPLERELALYIVHGLLHLQGFDDRSEAEAKEMRRLEAEILSRCQPPGPSRSNKANHALLP